MTDPLNEVARIRISGVPRLHAEIIPSPTGISADAGDRGSETTGPSPVSSPEAAFAENARRAAAGLPHVVLLSGGDHPCSRRSIAALRPALIFTMKDGLCRLESARGITTIDADPFDVLDALLAHWWQDDAETQTPLVAGYVAYEAGRAIESLPATVTDRLNLPDIWMCWPTELHVLDRQGGETHRFEVHWADDSGVLDPISRTPAEAGAGAMEPPRTPPPGSDDDRNREGGTAVERSFDQASYMAAVQRIRSHIYEGDVYQVNLSQRYRFPLREAPFALWLRLFAENPSPFYAWVDAGDHQVLSTSMERFFLIEGDRIETRPIKGTRPRGSSDAEAMDFAGELLASEKDDAELSMIVDLERNDLGKICAAGSVRVAAHKLVEPYANVQHLVSVVEGALLPGISMGDVFRALFPGGSITGCPKIRAMEIIDAIETETRHVYTGGIGYIAADGRADFNIAIRTAVVHDGTCHLSVGGGIVYDSDPAEEYFETLHKGRTFFQLAGVRTELD
jgi:para-aminobenzoate synthetase component 1